VSQQEPLAVYDADGTEHGNYFADMVVSGIILVEIKAVRTLTDDHVAQVLGYLRTSQIEHGLLINFGSPRLQIKKYAHLENFGTTSS